MADYLTTPFAKKNAPMVSERMSLVLQSGFKNFRDSGEFTDVTVCVEDATFRLHKSVLCATVPYFQSLFSSSFKVGVISYCVMRFFFVVYRMTY